MIKCVIFDLDGTLLNTLEDLYISTNFALEKFGYPQRTIEEIRCFVGDGVKKLIERAVPENCENSELCLKVFKEHYSKNLYNHTAPYNGIKDILKELRLDNFKIAVVSNKFNSAVEELCEKYFNGLVDIAIGQSEDVPPKPSPNGVLKAINLLNVDLQSTIYVGDSEIDVQTAHNAKIPCIAVTWGFRDKKNLEGAKFIVDSPCDIIKVVRSL